MIEEALISIILILLLLSAQVLVFVLKSNCNGKTGFIYIIMTLISAAILLDLYSLYHQSTIFKFLKVKNSAYDYMNCYQSRYFEDECDVQYAILQANKAEAELNGSALTKIEAAEKMGIFLSKSKNLGVSPYDEITQSLSRYPYYIIPRDENYMMYKECKDIEKPLYYAIAWHIKNNYNYIAFYQSDKCPKYPAKNFPVITKQQFENLKDGSYWRSNKESLGFQSLYPPMIMIIDDLNLSIEQIDEIYIKKNKDAATKKDNTFE